MARRFETRTLSPLNHVVGNLEVIRTCYSGQTQVGGWGAVKIERSDFHEEAAWELVFMVNGGRGKVSVGARLRASSGVGLERL